MPTTVKIPARDWTFQINTGTDAVPAFTAIAGINSWGHSPSKNDTDTTTFDDAGRLSHMPISRGDSFTIEGLYSEDPTTGDRDAGQEAVETAGNAVGTAGIKQFQITSPGGTVKTFAASYNVTIGGGGNDDGTAWSCEITVDGAITTA